MVARVKLPKEVYAHFIITSIKGNAPYFMIGFKNDEAFGKAMADAA